MTELRNLELIESLAEALETMAFIALSPPEGPIDAPTEAVLVWVEFRGSRSGRVELLASRQLGRLLLDNTLSCDPSDTLVMPNPADPLVELANITTGILLKRIGARSKCEMRVPKIANVPDTAAWQTFVDSHADVVMAEGHVIAISMVEE